MTKPTINELVEYFNEKLHDIVQSKNEAEKFFNHYSSIGWKVGKNPMVKWKFAVLNWIKNIKVYAPKTESGFPDAFDPDFYYRHRENPAKLQQYYTHLRSVGLEWLRVEGSAVFKWQKV